MMIYERDVKNAHVQLANKCLNREDNISKSVCVVRIKILRFEHTALQDGGVVFSPFQGSDRKDGWK